MTTQPEHTSATENPAARERAAEPTTFDDVQSKYLLRASPDDYWQKITDEVRKAAWGVRHAVLLNHEAAHLLAWANIARNAALAPQWRAIETAPRDGTLVELMVDYRDGGLGALHDALVACTIGFNSFDDNGEEDWKFAGWCWSHDHFTQGSGKVLAWRPSQLNAFDDALPAAPTAEEPQQ